MNLSSLSITPLCLLVLAPVWAQSGKAPDPKPRVVFVCEHGSAKSVIAAAEFSRMARESGIDLDILSRGTNPDAEIPKLVRAGLKADGHDIGAMKPAKVSKDDLRGATKIISFGPDLKPLLAQGAAVADWSATPSVSDDYRAARDYIRKRLEDLLKEIKKQ